MSDMNPEAGFSNSDPVEDAPQDVHPDVDLPEEPEPGFSNAKAIKGDEPADADAEAAPAADSSSSSEDTQAPAKKTAKKSAAKKKG